jgi:transposase
MQKFYEEYKEHLHIVYFPSYSPELDPIEQSWREAKKWLAIRYWENKSGLKQQLITAFQQGITMVPIYDYLKT